MPSFVPDNNADALTDALQALQNAAATPARSRVSKTDVVVNKICDHAFTSGLDIAQLDVVVDVITTRTELDQASITTLIKNLYPKQRPSNQTVTTIVGSFGQAQSKPSPVTQASLVRWLVLVYEFLEDATIISGLYGVLFSLLDMISLRLELANNVGNEPALLGLLAVYKDYYPDIFLGSSIKGRAKSFVVSTAEANRWDHRYTEPKSRSANCFSIQTLNGASGYTAFSKPIYKLKRAGIICKTASGLSSRAFKGAKLAQFPMCIRYILTRFNPSILLSRSEITDVVQSSMTLEEVITAEDLVANLERLELPSQLIASLHDPLLQKYLALRPSELSTQRIRGWLTSYDVDVSHLDEAGNYSRSLELVLKGIASFAQATKTIPHGAYDFSRRVLNSCDGTSLSHWLSEVFVLTALTNPENFVESTIRPIELRVIPNSADPFGTILHFYAKLARHLLYLIHISDEHPDCRLTKSYVQCFQHLAHHGFDILLPSLTSSPVSVSTRAAALNFIESLILPIQATGSATAPSFLQIPIILPTPEITYLLLFDASPNDLTRLCSILTAYKEALEKRRLSTKPPSQDIIGRFNGFLMDVCNLLWRSRALRKDDSHAMGCLFPEKLDPTVQEYLEEVDREYGLSFHFDLSHNPLLSHLSIAALRELEDRAEAQGDDLRTRHAGPVTQRSLVKLDKDGGLQLSWKDYRVQVLDYLERHSLGGIKELMFSTMKDLFRNPT
ncbi:MAG: hypothetical protein M1820_008637 [Bogoriella megaspora]|nr:MAG: hypothetical protein M1820_008637 [Bogoriella megaspora]